MPKLTAIRTIICMNKDDVLETISPRTVFDATVAQAKAFDALGAARPSWDSEIKADQKLQDQANGLAVVDVDNARLISEPTIGTGAVSTSSGAEGDPLNLPPKSKSK